MKARNRLAMKLAALVVVAPWLAGCEEEKATAATQLAPANTNRAAVAATNEVALEELRKIETATVQEVAPSQTSTNPALAEIVKLAESGVGDSVIVSYVENSTVAYDLSADDILYLHDQGLSVEIINAMIRRGKELRQQLAQDEKEPAPVKEPTPQVPETELVPEPEVPVVYNNGTEAAVDYSASTQPVYVNNNYAAAQVNYFYDDLAPHGSWYQIADYGWCWQPRAVVINRGWRPYRDRGRWIYSDCGWYWHSDYSWGWAPFHYGRWVDHSARGWMWIPDRVWAPAWVTWRVQDSYCGWAPLPPGVHIASGGLSFGHSRVGFGFGFGLAAHHFSFVHMRNFSDRNLFPHILRDSHARNVFHRSTVINNIVVGNNNTIVNEGIGYNRVAAVSRNQIPRARVRETPVRAGEFVKADRVERNGSSLVVYKPQALPEHASPTLDRPAVPGSSERTGRRGQETVKTPEPSARPMRAQEDANHGPSPAARADLQGRRGILTDQSTLKALEQRHAVTPTAPVAKPSVEASRSGRPLTSQPAITGSRPTATVDQNRKWIENRNSSIAREAQTAPSIRTGPQLQGLPQAPAAAQPSIAPPVNRMDGGPRSVINRAVNERPTQTRPSRSIAVPEAGSVVSKRNIETARQPSVSIPQPQASAPTPPVVAQNYRHVQDPTGPRSRVNVPNYSYSRPAQSAPVYQSPSAPPYQSPATPEIRSSPRYQMPAPVVAPSSRPRIESTPVQRSVPPPVMSAPRNVMQTPSYRQEAPRPSVSAPPPSSRPTVSAPAPSSRPSAPPSNSRSESGRGRDRN